MRPDGRAVDELRRVTITKDYARYPEGSVLMEMGDTRVLCNVTLDADLPPWLKGKGQGWVTAEYAMLPRSTLVRTPRETRGFGARTQEIRRFIGRALRASVDLSLLGERNFTVDCDVIQADGGTRTAAVTGGYIALALALRRLVQAGSVSAEVFLPAVAAVSVGLVDRVSLLDLCYAEDSGADVDFNVALNAAGQFVEVQGTAESHPFSRETLDQLLALAEKGVAKLLVFQAEVLR